MDIIKVFIHSLRPLIFQNELVIKDYTRYHYQIHGSILWGLLGNIIHKRLNLQNGNEGNIKKELFRELFFSENIVYTDLYPANITQDTDSTIQFHIAINSPLSVITCNKHPGINNHFVNDLLVSNDVYFCPECGSTLRPFQSSIYLENKKLKEFEWFIPPYLDKNVSEYFIKNKRPWYTVKNLKILPKNSLFIGYIILNSPYGDFLEKELLETMEGRIKYSIGTARDEGYGKVEIIFQKENSSNINFEYAWKYSFENRWKMVEKFLPPNHFIINCLSDIVLYDIYMKYQTILTPEILAENLNQLVPELNISKKNLELVKFFVSNGYRSGWNTYYRLPKPADWTIKASSVFLFKYKDVDEEKLKKALNKLEYLGLGLRRNEGFGRVVINHPIHYFLYKKD